MKDKIIKVLNEVNRPGIPNLINFLKESDFFIAPASVNHHLNWRTGLSIHSWEVKENLQDIVQGYFSIMDNPPSFDNVVIEGIGHDFAKLGKYKIDEEDASDKQLNYLANLINKNKVKKFYVEDGVLTNGYQNTKLTKSYCSDLIDWLLNHKEDDMPEFKESWTYAEDNFPFGHGEKSVSILQDFIKLEDREKLAIRYHMSSWEDGVLNGGKSRDFNRAKELYPDIQLLQMADYEATFAEQFMKVGD